MVNKIINKHQNKRALFLTVAKNGTILEMNQDLEWLDRENFFESNPFFESIPYIVTKNNPEQIFTCINFNFNGEEGLFDIEVVREDDLFYLAIFNFTEHYETSRTLAQERNESLLKTKLLESHNSNITLEKELVDVKNENLKKAQQFKDEFLANMSHEIRTPLNGILGFAKLLKDNSFSKEDGQRYIDAILVSGENLKIIINDILDFSKIEAGKLKINDLDFSFYEFIDNLHEIYKLRFKDEKLKLIFDVDPTIPKVLISDVIRLNQILTNLLENSFKFTKKGSIKLIVSKIEQSKKHVVLNFMVSDTGIGIKKDKLDSIFESFSQVHDNSSDNFGGTGLGLAIIKKLVDLMGGTIDVNSKFGLGTTFSVTFNLKISNNKLAKKITLKNKSKTNGSIKNKRILVAEDVKINQLLIEKILSNYGCKLTIVNNGQEAVNELSRNHYDLLLLDLKMPILDGYQTAHIIRNEMPLPNKNIPIIVLTAHAMDSEKQKCEPYNIKEYLSKPFDPHNLISKIEKALK